MKRRLEGRLQRDAGRVRAENCIVERYSLTLFLDHPRSPAIPASEDKKGKGKSASLIPTIV